jgi:poly-gamma-glutamate synthesis protein (capsule biosynthesis protein)
VYGHHAHVVQPMEKINGKWAIYGLGNNIAAQLGSAPGVQQGLLVRVQFSQDTAGQWTTSEVAWVASYQDVGAPYRWCALTSTDTCGTGDGTALAQTTAVVNRWGADTDGAHRID